MGFIKIDNDKLRAMQRVSKTDKRDGYPGVMVRDGWLFSTTGMGIIYFVLPEEFPKNIECNFNIDSIKITSKTNAVLSWDDSESGEVVIIIDGITIKRNDRRVVPARPCVEGHFAKDSKPDYRFRLMVGGGLATDFIKLIDCIDGMVIEQSRGGEVLHGSKDGWSVMLLGCA